jgi:hypothetical protein
MRRPDFLRYVKRTRWLWFTDIFTQNAFALNASHGSPKTAADLYRRPQLLGQLFINEGGFSLRYCLTSIVNSPGPVVFAVHVYGLPESAARLPVASFSSPFPEAVNPVGLPSVIVSVSEPSVFWYTAVAPGLRMTPLEESILAFGPFHSQIVVPVKTAPLISPESE